MQLIQAQSVLNPTRVGNSFLLDAHIRVKLVAKVNQYSHHTLIPKIKPGTMITALAVQDKNSTVL
jgi:hypothetical protein